MTVSYQAPSGFISNLKKIATDNFSFSTSATSLIAWGIGYCNGSSCRILSVAWTGVSCKAEELQKALGSVEQLVPVGLQVVALVTLAANDATTQLVKLTKAAEDILKEKGLRAASVPLLLINCQATQEAAEVTLFTSNGDSLEAKVTLQELPANKTAAELLAEDLVAFRLKASLELWLFKPDKQGVEAARLSAEHSLLSRAATWLVSTSTSPLAHMVTGNPDPCVTLGAAAFHSPATAQLYHRATGSSRPPCLYYQPLAGQPLSSSRCVLNLDILCFAPNTMTQHDATSKVLGPAVSRQLRVMCSLIAATATSPPAAISAFHFLPAPLLHPITLCYPTNTTPSSVEEERLRETREKMHNLLGLPTNRPLLRVSNALSFTAASSAASKADRLCSVHRGLPASGVAGGVQHIVDGDYAYYHYMQDKFDDSGWGCAYRSLQTLCSWFVMQGYCSRQPPSHKEIQQTLVKLGDKSTSFIGSKQWIGAIELGYILDELFGVTCKVITVTSGEDIPSKARELARHFDTQGSPIMIGGGVLAYTLLGIDLNEATGECAFLILDPHYTGPDDLKKIHTGDWVSWKRLGDTAAAGGDLFVKDAFYNLLCPQRPDTV